MGTVDSSSKTRFSSTIYSSLISLGERTCASRILSCSALVLLTHVTKSVLSKSIFSRSRRTLFDLNKSLWGGYAVWSKQYKFYFAGDTGYTDNIPIFRQIGKKYGPFDLSAIPIGAYEPRWMMEAQHVSPLEAVQMHIDTQSKRSIGIHWGTWALANEYFLEPKEKLAAEVKERQMDPDSFIVVKHGEIFDLPEKN